MNDAAHVAVTPLLFLIFVVGRFHMHIRTKHAGFLEDDNRKGQKELKWLQEEQWSALHADTIISIMRVVRQQKQGQSTNSSCNKSSIKCWGLK